MDPVVDHRYPSRMIPWKQLGVAPVPRGVDLSLWQRGSEYMIRAGATDLMSSRTHGSEHTLGRHGCQGVGASPSVLIGGLGMGFTLRAALDVLPPSARVVVAELVPSVVEWVRGPLAALGERVLEDPRVALEVRDVALVLRDAEARFDRILLDVDNGPTALTQRPNAWLYEEQGLRAAARALRPRGRLAIWSAGDDRAFARRLVAAGFTVETFFERTQRHGGRARGARHVIFHATLRQR